MAQKKIAVITGATGNVGLSVTQKFIDNGYKVIGTVLPGDTTPLHFPAASFEKVEVNLLNEEETTGFIADIIVKYGSISVAVLTVGGFDTGSIAETSGKDLLRQYQLNFETAYHIARPVFVQMLMNNSGRIFFIGSRPGLAAEFSVNMTSYGLAKSLVFRLAELINAEALGKNVVAGVIVPSTLDTPQNRKIMPDADFNKWVSLEDIANVIYYYSTDEAHALRETVIKVYNNA